jgi:putative membrane protein
MAGGGVFQGEDRRLHPATLMLAITKLGPQSLNMLPAFAAIGVTGNWRWVAPAILAFILLALISNVISWLRFTWRVDADDIAITSGVFSRNHRTIPFDRIQDVNIEQGLFARILGLAKVTLETGAGGGDKDDEGALNAIALEEARALRDHIRAHRSAAVQPLPMAGGASDPVAPSTADAAPVVAAGRELFAMTPQRLLIAGLFNFSLAIVAVLFGVLQTFDDILPFDPFSPDVWIDLANSFGLEQWVMAHRWLTVIGGIIALLVLGMLTGIVRMVMANWGFRLERTERGFRRTRGLTTRTDVVIPAARVQGAVISSGFIGRRFGWHSLALQSLASDGKDEADHVAAPFATLAEIDGILAELGLDRATLEEAPHRCDDVWQSIHWVDALGGVIFAAIIAVLAVGAAALIDDVPEALAELNRFDEFFVRGLAVAAVGLAALLLLISWLGWRNQRWTFDGRLLHIVRGALTRQHYVLPARNVQSADVSMGPITRRVDAATLTLGVPGGKMAQHRISALSRPLARVLRAQVLAAR